MGRRGLLVWGRAPGNCFISVTNPDRRLHCSRKWLLFQNTAEVVTDKSTDDKDDHEDDDINKNAKNSQETDINIHHARDKIPRGEHEDDSKDETNNRAIPEDAIVIFRSLVKKAKGNSQDQVQYFKQHDYSLDYGSIASPSPKSFRKSTGAFAGIAGESFFTMLKKRWIFFLIHQFRFPAMNPATPFFWIARIFFLCASPCTGLRKSSFSHVAVSPHSQHPAISFSWQHFRIWQNGGPPPFRHPFLQRNFTMAPRRS
jgi:hypothetical protein